jgi:N utilization substance protein A
LGDGLVEKLGAAGITTVEALADMTPEQLEAIEGIGPKTVEKISLAVNNYFASLEGEIAVEGEIVEGEAGVPESLEPGTEEVVAGGEGEVLGAETPVSGEEHVSEEPVASGDVEAESSAEKLPLDEDSVSEKTEQ